MEEEIVWRVKSKSGFSPNQRRKIAHLLASLGGGDPDPPGDDLLDSNGNNLLDSAGVELESAQTP